LADKRPKRPTYTTPVGIARYPHLNKPDTRFNADGDYKCDVRLKADETDTTTLIERLEKIRDDFFDAQDAKVKKTYKKAAVFTVELDDEGNETGYVIIKTKLNANGKDKTTGETWKNEPKLFDAKGNPLPPSVQVWSGSKVIVAGTVNTYAMAKEKSIGVTLKCRGVQVIELVSGGTGGTAESFGFKKQAGYTAPAAAAGIGNNDAGTADDEPTGDAAPSDGDEEF
jgi:hypothetical protein